MRRQRLSDAILGWRSAHCPSSSPGSGSMRGIKIPKQLPINPAQPDANRRYFMNVPVIAALAVGGVLLVAKLLPRMTEATRQAPWLAAYNANVARGATPAESIFRAVHTLKYRQPWQRLSDDDVRAFASTLAELRRPELFTEVMADIERTGDVSRARNLEHLRGVRSLCKHEAFLSPNADVRQRRGPSPSLPPTLYGATIASLGK